MILYVIIIGLGTLVGIIINVLINQKNIIYYVIGSVIILITGTLACFVIYYPFYFRSFHNLIISLIVAGVFIMATYIGLRLIVNTVMISNHHPSLVVEGANGIKPGAGEKVRPQIVKQKKNKYKKTIGTVQVTRLNKKDLLIARTKNSLSSNKSNDKAQPESAVSGISSPPAERTAGPVYGNMFLDVDLASENAPAGQNEAVRAKDTMAAPPIDGDQLQPEAVTAEETAAAIIADDTMVVSEAAEQAQTEVTAADDTEAAFAEETMTTATDEPNQPEAVTADETAAAIIADDTMVVSEAAEQKQTEVTAATDRYASLVDKAAELIGYGKYIYAAQLLQLFLNNAEAGAITKRADIMLLECLVMSEQFEQAQKKWLEVLNKMYILEPADKIQLKEILIRLNSRNKQVS